MATALGQSTAIIQTERGLTISGTRITLYDVMDYLKAGYPATLIREKLCLSDAQTNDALEYIAKHRAEVDAEYEEVLQAAVENRRYWETRNRDHFAQIAAMPHKPGQGQAALRTKLQAWKNRLDADA